jgi:predicted Zn-dependent protease
MMAEAKQELEDLYTRQKKPNTLLEIAVLNLRQNHRDTALKQLKQVITDSPSEPRLQKLANSLLMKARTQSA